MTRKTHTTPLLLAAVVALSAGYAQADMNGHAMHHGQSAGAQSMQHHMGAMHHAQPSAPAMDHRQHGMVKTGEHRMPDGSGMSNHSMHGVMQHDAVPAGKHRMPDGTLMDNGAMPMQHGESHGMHGSKPAARTTSRTPIPEITDADRAAAFPPLKNQHGHSQSINHFVLLDRLEYQDADKGSALAWEAQGWIGGDINKLWVRSEGERINGHTESADLQLLYGHSIGPWWDVLAGVKQDFKPGAQLTWGALGIQGVALYGLETRATAYVASKGQTALTLEGEYDMLITNKLILQPAAEVNFYGKNDRSRGMGSGLGETELGLRLRYEIVPEFAPYIGVTWNRLHGKTADYAYVEDEKRTETRFVAGVRWWF